ncbi:MAG: class I SAM-dependent methyltransferase [Bacteroidetes bacterium]|jgi:2-polyprenyl-3-methyl-5-hydroxy-6-metoxy-1,4-benzoquinol methylase|nr:class I SAM-dependent methyltransferase [Bacteroidota bacterium]
MEDLKGCPACESTNFREFISCKDFTVSGEYFTVNQCVECGLKFTSPRPSEEEIGKYYQSPEYISHTNKSADGIGKLYTAVRQFAVYQKVNLIRTTVPQNSEIIDLGAGNGYFVTQLISNGFKARGFEPSDDARKVAKTDFNIDIEPLDDFQSVEAQSVNCITLWHVLEHIHSLKKTLNDIYSKLTAEGYLIIAVPNPESYDAKHYKAFWAAYDVPRHLYHFSPQSIIKLLSHSGFDLAHKKPMWFDSTYVSLLSEKYKSGKLSLLQLIKGLWFGFISNVHGFVFTKNYSSHIYIFKKRN